MKKQQHPRWYVKNLHATAAEKIIKCWNWVEECTGGVSTDLRSLICVARPVKKQPYLLRIHLHDSVNITRRESEVTAEILWRRTNLWLMREHGHFICQHDGWHSGQRHDVRVRASRTAVKNTLSFSRSHFLSIPEDAALCHLSATSPQVMTDACWLTSQ